VSHSYTPGLRVTPHAVLQRERRLPLKGQVLVREGETVSPSTVVARTELPGNVQMLNLAVKLGLDPPRVPSAMLKAVGETVEKGDIVARAKSLFGLVQNQAEAPVRGSIESVSAVTGQLVLREPPIPVEVMAYVQGRVARVIPDEGVVVETHAAFLQGIFGVGGETHGAIDIVVDSPDQPVDAARLHEGHRGKVLVGGAYVSHAALMRARDVGACAFVVGGFDDRDLRQLLGKDLGVAITGSEDLGITLVLTEGFGHIRMAERTWSLLGAHRGQVASVSGATQIRAGVLRPEIVIPRPAGSGEAAAAAGAGLDLGASLRVIRAPYFGRIGKVVELPAELHALESEAMVRVVTVQFTDGGDRATVPRANVERIEE
jgi:hypothetical protein